MNWDPLQREVLEAMGHTLYREAARSPTREDAATPADDAAFAPDALQRALLRATGRGIDDAQAAALCRSWMPSSGLRSADAKRALWPRLRALRERAVP